MTTAGGKVVNQSPWQDVERFLTSLALEEGLSGATLAAYRSDLRCLNAYLEEQGAGGWQSVSSLDLTAFIRNMFDLGISAATVNRRLSALRGFFGWLEREGRIEGNPAQLIRGPQSRRPLPEVLTPQEVALLIAQPDPQTQAGERDRAILEMMYGSGLRVSEAVNIRLEHFHLEGKLLSVTGKGSKERLVPVGGVAQRAVRTYISGARAQAALRNPRLAGSWLFLSQKRGRRLTRQSVWLMIKACAASAGLLTKVTPHTLRHSFATHLLEGGANLREVQELLGHTSIDTTMIYTHIDKSHLLEVVRTCHPRN